MRLIKVNNDPELSLMNEKLSSLKLKTVTIALFLSAFCMTSPSTTFAQTSDYFGFARNHFWHGITQNDKHIADSGGFNYANNSEFYLGSRAKTLALAHSLRLLNFKKR